MTVFTQLAELHVEIKLQVMVQGMCFGQDTMGSRQRPLSLHPPETLFPNKTADFFTTDFTCSVITVNATRIRYNNYNKPVQHPNHICVDLMMAHCQGRNMSSG
jgi:hypothetical protein